MIREKEWNPLGKRHNWIDRNGGDLVYEIIVWDGGRKIDRFIFNNKTRFKEILELIRLKFGLDYK